MNAVTPSIIQNLPILESSRICKPAGARPDYRGRWCAVSRGHPGRPNPPSPWATFGQLSAAPWELPSTVGFVIAWTRTGDVQAIERILHSSECFYWMRCRQPPTSLHSADSPCSRLRATASNDNAALGNLQASPQAPGQTTGVAGAR
ncbi:UNVERIFIED_CONTAM: hypothetical protein FKN15_052373 [Acipenser sinensis]